MNESPIGPGEGISWCLCAFVYIYGDKDTAATVGRRRHILNILPRDHDLRPPSICVSLSLCGCYGLNRNFNSPLVTAPINGHDSKSSRGHALVPAQNLNCEYICHPPSPRERDVGKRKQREMEGEERKVALRIFEEIKGGLRFVNQVN